MKHLLQEWKQYLRRPLRESVLIEKKVNSWDSNLRFVRDVLVEVSDQSDIKGVSDEELELIKNWASLQGESEFLGTGSRGSAYKIGGKVVKITNDRSEAEAANIIKGKDHPNVYKIYKVGKRKPEMMESKDSRKFVVITEFLDYPNQLMADIAELIYYILQQKNGQRLYRWKDQYFDEMKRTASRFEKFVKENPKQFGSQVKKYSSIIPKLNELAEKIGISKKKLTNLVDFWKVVHGLYGSASSAKSFLKELDELKNSKAAQYFHQLANGLTFLAKNGILFDDLKKSNVMEKNGQICIIDIGYSTVRGGSSIGEIE